MRTGRPKQPLILSEEERARLQSLAHRARSQALLARRARVVLACGDGLDNQAVAKKLRCSLGMVGGVARPVFESATGRGCMTIRGPGRRARSAMNRWNKS